MPVSFTEQMAPPEDDFDNDSTCNQDNTSLVNLVMDSLASADDDDDGPNVHQPFLFLDSDPCRVIFKSGKGESQVCGRVLKDCKQSKQKGSKGLRGNPGYYRAMTPLKAGSPMDGDPAMYMMEEEGATQREDVQRANREAME